MKWNAPQNDIKMSCDGRKMTCGARLGARLVGKSCHLQFYIILRRVRLYIFWTLDGFPAAENST